MTDPALDAGALEAATEAYNNFEIGSDVDHVRSIVRAYLSARPGHAAEPALYQCELEDGSIEHFAAIFGKVGESNGLRVIRRTPLYTRPSPATCYECGTALAGPYCPACRPAPAPQGEDADVGRVVRLLNALAIDHECNDGHDAKQTCDEAADRLAALSAEVAAVKAERDEVDELAGVLSQKYRWLIYKTGPALVARAERAEAALAVKDKALDDMLFLAETEHMCLLAWNGKGGPANYDAIMERARAARQAGGDHER